MSASAWLCPCCNLSERHHVFHPPNPLEGPGPKRYCQPLEVRPKPLAVRTRSSLIADRAHVLLNVLDQGIDDETIARAGRDLHDLATDLIKYTDEFASPQWLVEHGYAPPF